MNLVPRKKTGFILGSFLLVLTFIALFMFRFSEPNNNILYEDSDSLVSTNDPLITKRLSERDLLPDDAPLITILDPSRGASDAPVVIVEFSDFECPFCKDSQKIMESILARYPDTVLHVWKDAPSTSLHKNAFDAHIAARCAQEQGLFWEFHDKLFINQKNLNKLTFLSIADETAINKRIWEQCFDSKATKAKVDRSIIEAEVLGVNTTPYFYINNRKLSGNVTFEQFDQIIQQELQ